MRGQSGLRVQRLAIVVYKTEVASVILLSRHMVAAIAMVMPIRCSHAKTRTVQVRILRSERRTV